MPRRSKITLLPPEIKAQFDKLLIEKGFSDYDGIAAWLQEQGYAISRSAAHRYGQEFEEKMAALKIATEQARAITEAVGDGEGLMGDALTSLCQEKAFQVLVKMQEIDPENVDFTKLTVAVSKLNKVAVDQKKWQAEAKRKAKDTADEVVKAVKKSGISEKTAEEIRKKILGIV
jgi:hypothetical protein